MLDLKHLRAFVAIASCGTIAKASRRLAIAESPLGRQLRRFERDLGRTLFLRRGRRLFLSPAGEELLEKAQVVLGHAEDFLRASTLADAGNTRGVVRLGLLPGVAWHPALGRLIHEIHRHHQGINLELAVDTSQFLVGGLRSGAHDLVLLRRPPGRPGLRSRLLCREELRLVAVRSLGTLTLPRLAQLPWLEPAGKAPPALLGALDAAGLSLRRRVQVPDLATAAALARCGGGVLLTHASVAEALHGVQVADPPFSYPAQEVHLAWRAAAGSEAVERVCALAGRIFTAMAR